ncbi:TadE family protein [Kribbia dieselivorans]|uniref:TadE family protein n=1 Tax=Kribbia dieselivorans TaxID=331526 RepID=UPI000A83F0BD|nr:TadE family protein [Kribbia dieselivorans]
MTDFVMVVGLLMFVFLAVLQLGFALHVRNTLVSCASEGARYGARADSTPAQGTARARDLITRSVSSAYADNISAWTETTSGGVDVVVVRVRAPIPAIGLIGVGDRIDVTGRAYLEGT